MGWKFDSERQISAFLLSTPRQLDEFSDVLDCGRAELFAGTWVNSMLRRPRRRRTRHSARDVCSEAVRGMKQPRESSFLQDRVQPF